MIHEIATLYKRGRNSILEWTIKVESVNKQVNIFMSYGLFRGEQVIRYQNNIKGKNKGKSNETSDFEQAILEAQSKVNLKLKEGYKNLDDLQEMYQQLYFATSDLFVFLDEVLSDYNTDVNGNEIPMKCQQYYRSKKDWRAPDGTVWDDRKYYHILNPFAAKEKDSIISVFPCYIQPKVNGVRAFAKLVNNEVKLYSKKGLEYDIPQVKEWLLQNSALFTNYEQEIIYDGELYIPGESLQVIASAVKATQLNTMRVEFHVFDIAIEDVPQDERFNMLYSATSKSIFNSDLNSPVKLVPTKRVITDTRVQELTDEYISEGYEGSICRDFKGLYEFGKRPKTITKLKRITDEEFIITDVVPSEKDETIGLFVCVTQGGKEFKVNPKGTTEFKRQTLYNRESFIGKELTCYFYEYTDDGAPFHIIDNIVRDYE